MKQCYEINAKILKALADPSRLEIIDILSCGEKCACDILENFGFTQPTLSHVGNSGVDKRIDIFVTAITFKAHVEDLFHLDLAYAPPFSTTKDPVMYTGMILDNAINRDRKLITSKELKKLTEKEDVTIIDTRVQKQYEESHVANAINIPHAKIRENCIKLNKDKFIITYCNKGVTCNAVQNILINNGFKNVYNLSGGHKNYKIQKNE